MLKEHKCICSRSEAFIPEVSLQIEGLSTIISKEWTEEAEASSSIIQIYCNPRVLLCTIGDAGPQETFYDPKVGVHLKWIDNQIVESKGILHAMSLKMGRNKVFF